VLSAGCAVQNMLLLATAMGLGTALTSGKALKSPVLRQGFRLSDTEHAICFISVGTVSQHKPGKPRPDAALLVSAWEGA
jgi:nitroreductase